MIYYDPSGKFAISTFLISLAVGALVTWVAGEIFGHQLVGGIGSMTGGYSAIFTGINLFAFGPWGIAAGIALIAVGSVTAAFGINEIVSSATGTSSVRDWMGEGLYDGLYIGANIIPSVGQIAGNIGMRIASNKILNSIVQNPAKVTNYKLWQMKTFGRYTSKYNVGVLDKGTHMGDGLTLTNKLGEGYGYIQWHPGSGRHGNVPYYKVASHYHKAVIFDYYLKEILDIIFLL